MSSRRGRSRSSFRRAPAAPGAEADAATEAGDEVRAEGLIRVRARGSGTGTDPNTRLGSGLEGLTSSTLAPPVGVGLCICDIDVAAVMMPKPCCPVVSSGSVPCKNVIGSRDDVRETGWRGPRPGYRPALRPPYFGPTEHRGRALVPTCWPLRRSEAGAPPGWISLSRPSRTEPCELGSRLVLEPDLLAPGRRR